MTTLGGAAGSAAAAAVGRATESSRPKGERLFDDPFALAFLPPLWRVMARLIQVPGLGAAVLGIRERQYPGVIGNLLCRTRFIDDALREALDEGLDQVVVLGAGLDSRAYRIPGIDRVRVFEVDHPSTMGWKERRVREVLGGRPPHVTFVPVDFNRQKLDSALEGAGYRTGVRAFFIWEGVTQYITGEAVDATLRYVARSTTPGSRIVFTYIRRGIVDGTARSATDQRIVGLARQLGVPWVFGLDPDEIEGYLAARGFALVDHAGAAEYRERYLEPLGRRMRIFEGERIILAKTVAHGRSR